MKKNTRRLVILLCVLGLLAVPTALFGRQYIASLITPTKKMYNYELEGEEEGENEREMDLPNGSTMDKQEYLRLREEYIGQLRGLPLEKGDERFKAASEMQRQEKEIAQRGYSPAAVGNWSYLGPSPIPVSVPTSGRVSAIAVHPTNPDIAYVGAAQGGLYRTLNGGLTWTPLLDNALTLSIGAVAIAPSDPTTVYVGTGESGLSADSFFGVGIYRITTADTSPVLSDPIGSAEFTGRAISELIVHPTDANTIFVSTTTGTCGTGGCTGAPAPTVGVYRSSNALSATPTFTRILSGSTTDIAMEPGTPDNLLAWIRGGVGVGGVFKSTNAMSASPTFAQTYANVTANSRGELAIQKTGTTVTAVAAAGEIVGGATEGTLFKSVNGGTSFTQMTAGNNFCNPQCFYDIAVAFDPNVADTIYLAGSPTAVFRRSFNGGTSFASSSAGLHVDTHAIAVSPSNPQIIYYGSDGGIYRSVNGGTNWSSLNNSTFAATQFQSIAIHPLLPNYSLGGTQDNGTELLVNDGVTWINSDGGDGGNVVIDQNATGLNDIIAYHTYFNRQNSQIGFSRATTTIAGSGDPNWGGLLGCGGTANGISCADTTLFYAPMVGGPGTPNSLYFGSNKLYRSGDQGTTMVAASQTFASTVSAIAVSRQNDNVRLVGLSNGTVFATASGSATMTQMTGGFPTKFVGRTAIDPSNPDIGYVTFNGYSVAAGQHVFKTTNLTSATPTWAPAGNGIPDVPVTSFAIDPQNSNNIFAGTDIGVYNSIDGGANWSPINNGQLPRVAVFDMVIHPVARVLRIATHGRGMWQIPLIQNAVPVTISGKVTTPSGLGLRNATVVMTDQRGIRTTATTSSFGLYSFTGVATGQSYFIGVSSKRYRFTTQNVNVAAAISNLDFVGLE